MKLGLFAFVAVIAIFSISVPSTNALMEDSILAFLEELKMRMCHPIPKFGLPALDPLRIGHVETAIDNKYIVDFTGSLTNFALTGLSDFEVTSLKITTTPLRRSNMEIVMPMTVLNSLYTAKGSLARVVNLNGDGTADGRLGNAKLAISWVLSIIGGVSIRGLTVELSIGEIWINIEELIEEPRVNDFFHALINEMGIELLNDVWVEAQEKGVVQYIEDMVNGFLGNYSLTDILKIIAGIAGGGGGEGGGAFDGIPPDCKDPKVLS
ncbi:uncharacterized protein LOC142220282 [Haematobia irritans]|uniref:uncharacterized protein LOC142220282 n=1 Tax=Haematobia irritans TaxID=7368 RepID=UPI003F5079A0